MPSRRSVALILAFWVAVTGYVAYRDVWPRVFGGGAPTVAVELSDEATQSVAVRWAIHVRGQPKPGKLVTQMKYVDADDTFRFTYTYTDLRFETGGVVLAVPNMTSVVRVTRGGDLREQSVEGKMEATAHGVPVEASVKIRGTVAGKHLTATCEIQALGLNINKTLAPVPVPGGQPLNPLQPVNRLTGVRPGRRWEVRESNPLNDALGALLRENVGQIGKQTERPPPIGEVLSDPQELDWHRQSVSCWVIGYRREGELIARTWVRRDDGKVLLQEAFEKGEAMSIVRAE